MTHKYVPVIVVFLFAVILSTTATSDEALKKRKGKFLSFFQIVTFPNDVCDGGGSMNGTCYTAAECTAKAGVNSGTCAQSYGVCCVFTINSGAISSQNNTYFTSTSSNAGIYSVQICKASPNICQLRLDFNTFMITGPSTLTESVLLQLNGQPITAAGGSVNAGTQCLTDTFSVTNPNGQAPPVICGTNTNEHMYVDASPSCNTLAFQLGTDPVGASLASRSWTIKISQYACAFNNLAPNGCTQYYYGADTGIVKTYNFVGGVQLANQNQNICIRRERGNCRICWSNELATDFAVSSGVLTSMMHVTKQHSCCAYGAAAKGTSGADCALIPSALTTMLMYKGATKICGSAKGLFAVTAIGMKGLIATVCSDHVPFSIRHLSDNFESMMENMGTIHNKGFKLSFMMTSTGCQTTTG